MIETTHPRPQALSPESRFAGSRDDNICDWDIQGDSKVAHDDPKGQFWRFLAAPHGVAWLGDGSMVEVQTAAARAGGR